MEETKEQEEEFYDYEFWQEFLLDMQIRQAEQDSY